MTEHSAAFIELINQRDLFYLYVVIVAVALFMVYRLFFRAFFKLAITAIFLLVAVALVWGFIISINHT